MPGVTTTTHAKIASAGTVSNEVSMKGLALTAVQFPAAFTGLTVTFQTAEKPSAEGGVYSTATTYTSGTGATVPVSVAVTAGAVVFFNVNELLGNSYMRIVSASAEAADRELTLYTVSF